ncbi:MAG: hypothetical protein U0670_11025 [Anaerolineae bacterium]
MLPNLSPRELRDKVDQQISTQRKVMRYVFFGISVGLFVIFSAIAAGMLSNAFNSVPNMSAAVNDQISGAFILFFVGWLLTLIYQGITLITDSKVGERAMRRQAVAQVLAREQLEQIDRAIEDEESVDTKRKRDAGYELTTDGELRPLDDISADDAAAQQAAA